MERLKADLEAKFAQELNALKVPSHGIQPPPSFAPWPHCRAPQPLLSRLAASGSLLALLHLRRGTCASR